mmetsp:Transcript_74633/g.205756  ORF Transcript_74633/g.205756 Transcript_74633/m.205756 type:complete len:80 (-) Transcript_74633:283-522(-)
MHDYECPSFTFEKPVEAKKLAPRLWTPPVWRELPAVPAVPAAPQVAHGAHAITPPPPPSGLSLDDRLADPCYARSLLAV